LRQSHKDFIYDLSIEFIKERYKLAIVKRHNDQHLKDVLKEMVEKYRLRSKLNQTKIKALWNDLMGPSISRYTTEINIRGKKLYVGINSASLRQELSMGRDKIRKIINEELGEEYIQEVVIR